MAILSTFGAMTARGFGWLLQTSAASYEVYTFGANTYGNLGVGNTTRYSSPVQVGSRSDNYASALSLGGFYGTTFVKLNGSLYVAGNNTYGQLGLGDTTHRSSPVQVGADSWLFFVITNSGQGVRTNGTMWVTGYNADGRLGVGDTTNRSSPTQLGAATNWTALSNGGGSLYGIRGGALYGWGNNGSGQLGQSNTTFYSSPVQIGGATNWSSIAAKVGFSVAGGIRGGALYMWGYNGVGQLGQNNVTDYSSPVQVGAGTNWAVLVTGNSTFAIKTDGTLWAWGTNADGALGLGNLTNYSSPVQVGTLTTWLSVSVGQNNAIAIKTDGTLWSWGTNGNGELGLNDLVNRSSPVQVGSTTAWIQCSTGPFASSAVRS